MSIKINNLGVSNYDTDGFRIYSYDCNYNEPSCDCEYECEKCYSYDVEGDDVDSYFEYQREH